MPNFTIDREEWAKRTIFEQMGNIGSEVGRSIKAHRSGNLKREEKAVERALDLIDATVEVWVPVNSARAKEILRAREQYVSLFYGGTFEEDADAIERYFMNFAVAARVQAA